MLGKDRSVEDVSVVEIWSLKRTILSTMDLISGHGRPLLERLRAQEEKNEVMEALEEYRKPRNALLVLVANYVSICTQRVEEIRKTLPPRFVIPDLLDDISIIVSRILRKGKRRGRKEKRGKGRPGSPRTLLHLS